MLKPINNQDFMDTCNEDEQYQWMRKAVEYITENFDNKDPGTKKILNDMIAYCEETERIVGKDMSDTINDPMRWR